MHQEPRLPLHRDLRERVLRPGDVPPDIRAGPEADRQAHGAGAHPEADDEEPDPEADDKESHRPADGEADRQADGQTDGQADRQTDCETDRQAHHGGARHRPADPHEFKQS